MKKILSLTLLFIAILPSILTSKWEIVLGPQEGDGTNFRCIRCFDSLNCIAWGNEKEKIPFNIITRDAGKTWSKPWYDTTQPISLVNSCSCLDSNFSISSHEINYNLISTDNFKTWEKVFTGYTGTKSKIAFANKDFGICMYGTDYTYSKDGGQTWKLSDSNFNKEKEWLYDFKLLDANTLFFLTFDYKNKLYNLQSTYDAGASWQKYLIGNVAVSSIEFVTKNIGWVCGEYKINTNERQYHILKTSDAGKTWITQFDHYFEGNPDFHHCKIKFLDSLNGIFFRVYHHVFKTSDGGEHWKNISKTDIIGADVLNDYIDAAFLNKTDFLVVTNSFRMILKYTENHVSVPHSSQADYHDFQIYPNPVESGKELTLKFANPDLIPVQISLINVFGEVMETFSNSFQTDIAEIKLNLGTNVSPGLYFLRLQISNRVITKRLIIY